MSTPFAIPKARGRSALTTALALTLVFALAACDTASPETADATGAAAKASRQASGQAVYEARLTPLNPSVNGQAVTGKATFIIDGDEFTAMVDARGLAAGIPHLQHIHAGPECPTMADDANGDGVLDLIEGIPVYGGILVQLDDDLADGDGQNFPVAESKRGRDAYGMINYEETVSLKALMSTLAGEDLALETRHVVLHGVAPSTDLPETVAPAAPRQVTLPVACGEIRRVR